MGHKKFKKYRAIDRDITQAELAEETGVAQARISLYERGIVPNRADLERLRDAGVPVGEFWPEAAAKLAA